MYMNLIVEHLCIDDKRIFWYSVKNREEKIPIVV